MGILSKIFGDSLESEKRKKMKEVESQLGTNAPNEVDKKITEWLVSRGKLAEQEGEKKEASWEFKKARKDFETAEKYFREALKTSPDHLPTYKLLSKFYLARQEFDKCVGILTTIPGGSGANDFDIKSQIATIFFEMDQREQARAYAGLALKAYETTGSQREGDAVQAQKMKEIITTVEKAGRF